MKALYSDTFVLTLAEQHRFPMAKDRLLRERLVDEGILSAGDLHVPEPIREAIRASSHSRTFALPHRRTVGPCHL